MALALIALWTGPWALTTKLNLGGWQVRVDDDGPGIPPEVASQVFAKLCAAEGGAVSTKSYTRSTLCPNFINFRQAISKILTKLVTALLLL